MKKFNKQLLLFKDISGKKIEADFNGGEVSSDAGILTGGIMEGYTRKSEKYWDLRFN